MKIKIEIECDDRAQFYQHLRAIREQAEHYNLEVFETKNISFEDNNCYGTHTVKVRKG